MNMLQKQDMVLATAILLMTAVAFGISHYTRRAPTAIARVSLDGTVVETLDLSRDTKITVTSPNNGTSHLIIKDGEIWYSETSCPDKVYAHQGKEHLNSDTIVCLPNQMIVTITNRR